MSIKYSSFIDPEMIERIVGADYINEARVVQSGLTRSEGTPGESSQVEWLRQTIFSGDDQGQTIGVDTEIDLKNKVQVRFALPIVWRADGAELDDISEEIMAKRTQEGAEADATSNLANAISAKSAQMVDSVAVKVIDGAGGFIITDANNFNNADGQQANLVDLEQTKSTRGEKGINFEGGFMVMRGLMFHKLNSLGLIAATSNTLGNIQQDEVVRTGVVSTLLGMNVFPTDKIALESGGDHFIHFIERGALRMLMGANPDVDPVIRSTRAFKDSIKFRIKLGGMIDGLSWTDSKVNPALVTNTELADGTNYKQAAVNIKNVPMAVVRFDAPTF